MNHKTNRLKRFFWKEEGFGNIGGSDTEAGDYIPYPPFQSSPNCNRSFYERRQPQYTKPDSIKPHVIVHRLIRVPPTKISRRTTNGTCTLMPYKTGRRPDPSDEESHNEVGDRCRRHNPGLCGTEREVVGQKALFNTRTRDVPVWSPCTNVSQIDGIHTSEIPQRRYPAISKNACSCEYYSQQSELPMDVNISRVFSNTTERSRTTGHFPGETSGASTSSFLIRWRDEKVE